MKLLQPVAVITLTLILSGCAELTWQSPFDVGAPTNGVERDRTLVDADDVDIIERDNNAHYSLLSIVTGDSCQKRLDQPKASEQSARALLRADAARFAADAIIDSQCFALPKTADSSCYTQVSCFGKAVKVH